MCRESLPRSSVCILLINLANSHTAQVKTNLSSATSKHCCVMSLQPRLREMFQRLWTEDGEEEGCSVSYGLAPWAKPLFWTSEWIWTDSRKSVAPCKYTSLTIVHTMLTAVLVVSLTDREGFPATVSLHIPWMRDGDLLTQTLQVRLCPCVDRAKRSAWVPPIKYSEVNVWAGPLRLNTSQNYLVLNYSESQMLCLGNSKLSWISACCGEMYFTDERVTEKKLTLKHKGAWAQP